MKITIIASNPRNQGESDITHLIGQEFDVIDKGKWDGGVDIPHGTTGKFFVYNDEFEIVTE